MPLDMEQAQVGTKVICVDGYDVNPGQLRKHPVNYEELSFPKTGVCYTIREVLHYTGNAPGLLFYEVQNPAVYYPRWGKCEPCWDPVRFDLDPESCSQPM